MNANVESIGERLYRKVVTPVYSDDGKTYTAGCVVRGRDLELSVRFYLYEIGKGIVGRAKPSDEIEGWLKKYGRDLKDYLNGPRH